MRGCQNYLRFVLGLPDYLRTPISYEAARATILRRREQRNDTFLRLVRRAVYDNPASPYLPLLRDARCEYGDLVRLLATGDLEMLLTRLWEAGVRISFEEFKRRRPIVGGGTSYSVADTEFDNPLLRGGVVVSTGGSTGRPSRMLIDLDFLADRAPYEQLLFTVLDLHRVPLALWYPKLPVSIGLSNSLRYAKIGCPPARWFDMRLEGRAMPAWHGWALSAIVGISRLTPVRLPRPVPAPLAAVDRIVEWMLHAIARHGRCAVQSSVSGVIRVCRAATARGVRLQGVQFITGSEPLTPSRHAEIDATGARVFLRYQATDLGSIASGCGAPDAIDDLHVLADTIGVIAPTAEENGSRRLYLTSTLDTGPKVVINVDLGDCAELRTRRCGCVWDEMGFHTHVSNVRSVTRSTAEGLALPYADLIGLTEEVLPGLLGGSALDYQWVEDEDRSSGGLTRLWLRVAPRLGALDEGQAVRAILDELGRRDGASRFYARFLDAAQTIRILRETPRTTVSGKTPALVKGREAGIPPAGGRA